MFSIQMIIQHYHAGGVISVLENENEVAEFIAQISYYKNYKYEKLLKDRLDQLGIPGSIKRLQKFLIQYSNKYK